MAVTTNFHHFKHPLERMFPDQYSSIMKANLILIFNVFLTLFCTLSSY